MSDRSGSVSSAVAANAPSDGFSERKCEIAATVEEGAQSPQQILGAQPDVARYGFGDDRHQAGADREDEDQSDCGLQDEAVRGSP